MSLKVSVHLRHHPGATNFRARAVAAGLAAAGATVVELHRAVRPCPDADLVIQTGLQASQAMRVAIEEGIPYIIAECPAYRHIPQINNDTWVSWGYGGLMGGAWHPEAPKATLWKPRLKPIKRSGEQVIFCQKSNDHSLRGGNHDAWIEKKLIEWPDAIVRPHPLMWKDELEPVADVLRRCYHAITYSSTAGVEALIEGCVSHPEHWGSSAYNVFDRRKWWHELSYQHFTKEMMASKPVGQHIISGFEEARARAQAGQQEFPRDKNANPVWKYSDAIEKRIRESL